MLYYVFLKMVGGADSISNQVCCFTSCSLFISVSQIFVGNSIYSGQVFQGEELPLTTIVTIWFCNLMSTINICIIYFYFRSCYLFYNTI